MFVTRRESLDKKYEAAGRDFIVSTKPYHSTVCLTADIVDKDTVNNFGFAVFRKGQVLDFFSYGIGDSNVPFGGYTRKATDADTNISKAKNTNGAADFVIEGLSMQCRGVRLDDGLTPLTPPPSDPSVVGALVGKCDIVDPGSIITPPQVYSPFNLENAAFNGILGQLAVQLTWDEDRIEKLGHCLSLAQGGGGSVLRANGQPRTDNIFKVPEGYLWAKVGGDGDCDLVVRCTLSEDVVMPITLVASPNDDDTTQSPTTLWLDLVCKLHGFEFKYPSKN